VCKACRLLISPERALQSAASQNEDASGDQVRHFAKVNQHDLPDLFQAKLAFQECYAMAYSLKVLLKSVHT